MNIRNLIIICIIIFLSTFSITALSKNFHSNNNFSSVHTINSKAFNQKREIQVYLPDNYKSSTINYPVLYIMDGEWYFLHGVSYQKSLRYIDHSPNFIVVGINTEYELEKRQDIYRTQAWDKVASAFIDFFHKELIPYVDKNFRTSKERVYFGWEIAGTLGVELLINQPKLFSGYILASPTPLKNDHIESIKNSITTNGLHNKFIYFSISPVEKWAVGQIKKLATIFSGNKKKNLKWEYQILKKENHYTTPHPSIYYGLSSYFNDYAPIRFYSILLTNLKNLEG